MQVSVSTIGIRKSFKYHSEIHMCTIDVTSADLNDRVGCVGHFDLFLFLAHATLYFVIFIVNSVTCDLFILTKLKILWDNALWILSEFFLAINNSFALQRVSTFLQRILLVGSVVNADGWSVCRLGNFGLIPIATLSQEKPCKFVREFLALPGNGEVNNAVNIFKDFV